MTQGFKNFPSYFTKFHRYAKKTGWNKPALINRLVKSLNPKLKVFFIGVKLLDTITAYANIINSLYNDLLHLTLRYTS